MTRKPIQVKGETRVTFMFPSLHEDVLKDVSDYLAPPWFNNKPSDQKCEREYSTHVMGKFKCNNKRCSSRGWGSKKVAILIRGYSGNGYSAIVYNQRCKACKGLGTFTLDKQSYIDRVVYRLKKWAGIQMEQRAYQPKESLPHEKELCEGCKRGVCQEMTIWELC